MSDSVLALDISTIMGVCVFTSDGVLELGREVQFKGLKGIERVDAFLGEAVELVQTYSPKIVVLEGYGYANAHTLATLVEIGTAVRLGLHACGVIPMVVAPSQLKKFATGKGNAKKEQIILEVFKRWGFTATTNNIADAYVLGKMGLARAWPEKGGPLMTFQAEVMGKIQ